MTLKEITRLSKICVKFGITHIKLGDLEMTLDKRTASIPVKRSKNNSPVNDSLFETDEDNVTNAETQLPTPTEQDLLFWSSEPHDSTQ